MTSLCKIHETNPIEYPNVPRMYIDPMVLNEFVRNTVADFKKIHVKLMIALLGINAFHRRLSIFSQNMYNQECMETLPYVVRHLPRYKIKLKEYLRILCDKRTSVMKRLSKKATEEINSIEKGGKRSLNNLLDVCYLMKRVKITEDKTDEFVNETAIRNNSKRKKNIDEEICLKKMKNMTLHLKKDTKNKKGVKRKVCFIDEEYMSTKNTKLISIEEI